LAEKQGDPILELGCGTGRVLLPLAQAGYRVYGLDHDADMLAYLHGLLDAPYRGMVNLIQADMSDYSLHLNFPLILLPCNTYTTLNTGQRLKALALVRRHLKPGGIFSASIPNPDYLLGLPKTARREIEDVILHPVDGEPVQVSSAWRRTPDQFVISWTYDHLLPDGTVERFAYQVNQNILPVKELLSEFCAAGLKVTDIYGDFEGSSLSVDSLYLVIVTTRDDY
jgi:SAM-dependent methyltransferase